MTYGNPSFGQWLRQRRQLLDLTHYEVADQLACSVSLVRKFERGERRPPIQMAERLAEVLSIPSDQRLTFFALARNETSAVPTTTEANNLHSAPTYVPAIATPLIGRNGDLLSIERQLLHAHTRLLTLTGPPGVGKTRLAQHIAHSLQPVLSGRIVYIPFAPLTNQEQILPAIAQALGINQTDDTALGLLILRQLAQEPTLLVLDNFEHLLVGATKIAELLAGCHTLKLLVTSRAALHIRAERTLAITPLSLPIDQQFALIAESPAVALFVDRTQTVQPDFMLTKVNAHVVAKICTRLDGLPLAIELAATRIGMFGVQGLYDRLQSAALPILTNGSRDLLVHQQTLRNTIAWSFQLLTVEQQVTFARLGVLVGDWALTTAEALCHNIGELPAVALQGLLEHSLIQQSGTSAGIQRFSLLETLREFALEQLQLQAAFAETQALHAEHFAALAEQAEIGLTGSDIQVSIEHISADLSNFRNAMEWSVGHDHGLIAARITSALELFWRSRGAYAEGCRWVEPLLQQKDLPWPLALRAKATAVVGFLAAQQSDTRSVPLIEQSVSLYRQLDDWRGLARTLLNLGMIRRLPGMYSQAKACYDESLALQQAHGDRDMLGKTLDQIGLMHLEEGQYAAAEQAFNHAVAIDRGLNRPGAVVRYLPDLAEAVLYQGDLQHAQELYNDALTQAQRYGDREVIAEATTGLGLVAMATGAYPAAQAYFSKSLVFYREMNINFAILRIVRDLGFIAFANADVVSATAYWQAGLRSAVLPGHIEPIVHMLYGLGLRMAQQQGQAIKLLAAAEQLTNHWQLRPLPYLQMLIVPQLNHFRQTVGDQAWQAALQQARLVSTAQIIAEALANQ